MLQFPSPLLLYINTFIHDIFRIIVRKMPGTKNQALILAITNYKLKFFGKINSVCTLFRIV